MESEKTAGMSFMRFSLMLGILTFLSGCTVAHFHYVRNLSEAKIEIEFVFDQSAAPALPDSLFIPFSSTAHLVNSKTPSYMTDSIIARKQTLTKMRVSVPAGSMIMIDKTTSKKIGYHDPLRMEFVNATNGKAEVIYFAESAPVDGKKFRKSGSANNIHYYDIY